ncbi:precorrin-6A synthase (deacetylating) [Phaeospirillum tilakii]|uniref:Precorrin-6A synthase [deacetylating] n=1 Tax=Phaeospirillum tilakii TaxID=741673 RepID=A0ABW5C977_9PROT
MAHPPRKTLLLIGIGPGDPDALTLAAVKAIQQADLFFFLDKDGPGTESLIRFRQDILDRHRDGRPYRVARAPSPPRDRTPADYHETVVEWRDRRTALIAGMIERELAPGECGAFLIWGDPCLYDGTLQSLRELIDRDGAAFDLRVIPGITSVQMLAARHAVPLNRIGESVTITTGRQLETGDPAAIHNAVVMLDSRSAFRRLDGTGTVDIYWGADVGSPDETLIAGPLDRVAGQIEQALTEQRRRKGWVMDCYLLRRREEE